MIKIERCVDNVPIVFAIDILGSTGGKGLYYGIALSVVRTHFREGRDKIIMWDNSVKASSKAEFENHASKLEGCGDTDPRTFIRLLPKEGAHLVVITDGEIHRECVNGADKLIKGEEISFVFSTIIVISNQPDLSVASAFCCSCESEVYSVQGGIENPRIELMTHVKKEDFKVLKSLKNIKSIEMFKERYDSIKRALQARTIGTNWDEQIKQKANQ